MFINRMSELTPLWRICIHTTIFEGEIKSEQLTLEILFRECRPDFLARKISRTNQSRYHQPSSIEALQ
jgi:hypothetical protein